MSEPRVLFDRVSKKFRKGERHNSLRDLIPSLATRAFRRRAAEDLEDQEFWAVRDVSFEVLPGQALGIIGSNGAGKSTTLKLLTRILRPTAGTSLVRGRVGALIEIAAGFHPDLTGRENIFLQGAIMGMKRAEIDQHIDEIIDFAGVSAFIDTPVKRYSSGMNARLGFAVAAHLDPDVLIIDEVLSVGDMEFQQRCVERMLAFKRQGVTVVFVSHNLQSVSMLCERALLLDKGRPVALGPTEDVMESYLRSGLGTAAAGDELTLEPGELLTDEGRPAREVRPGAPLRLRVHYAAREYLEDVSFGFVIYRSTDLLLVFHANYFASELGLDAFRPGDELALEFSLNANLTRGHYHVECHAWHNPRQIFLARVSPAAHFTVQESRSYAGVADVELAATVAARSGKREEGTASVEELT